MTLAIQQHQQARVLKLPEDRLPPQNIEAEESVLGSILQDNSVLYDVAMTIEPEDFYRASHQTIYQAITSLYTEGQPVDAVTLAEELTRRGQFDAVGGDETLVRIIEAAPSAVSAKYHAQIVKQKAIGRTLIQCANEMLRDGYSNNFTAEELLESAERKLFAVASTRTNGSIVTAAEAAGSALATVEARLQGVSPGIPTGYAALDEKIDGLRPGNMIVLAARPSQGKSALALNIAEFVALKMGVPVGFVSLEMSKDELGQRLLTSQSRTPGSYLKNPRRFFKNDTMGNLHRVVCELTRGNLLIDETAGRTLSQIVALARQWRTSQGIGLLVVDYLGKIDGQPQRGESRQAEVARISTGLKRIARECKIPVLVLHQLNRQSELREDRRPRMADLRDSGQIEQDADVIMLLHRPETVNPHDRPGEADLFVAKNRMGATGALRLTFLAEISRFENMAQQPAQNCDDDWRD